MQPTKKRRIPLAVKIAIPVVLIILAGSYTGFLMYQNAVRTRVQALGAQEGSSKSTGELLAKAAAQRQNKDYDGAIATLNDALKQVSASSDQVAIQVNLGAIYGEKKDYKQALATFQAAEKLDNPLSYKVAIGIAQAAEASGDKTLAAAYYHKALALTADSTATADIQTALKRVE